MPFIVNVIKPRQTKEIHEINESSEFLYINLAVAITINAEVISINHCTSEKTCATNQTYV